MEATTYTHARRDLAGIMDKVNDDHAPVIVTRQRGKPVVVMSLDDYHALEETAYLLRNPRGAERLLTAVERLRAGGGEARELLDADSL
ncbi:type II toxin-antitoxin system Phd/YefM family antitoxin [Methylomagnum sp.]